MSKPIKKIEPTLFDMPFASMSYLLITDRRQLKRIKGVIGEKLLEATPKKKDIEGFRAIAVATTVESYGRYGVIYYPQLLTDDVDLVMQVLCHECVHLWQGFHKDVICEDQPSDEFEAYTVDQIFGNTIEEYRKLLKAQDKLSGAACGDKKVCTASS